MIKIVPFVQQNVVDVVVFEKELRRQEPDIYFEEIDENYIHSLMSSFMRDDFKHALSFLAYRNSEVIGRIDAVILCSKKDPSCSSSYLDWICVLKSERNKGVAKRLLSHLQEELKRKEVDILIAIAASNVESMNFYRSLENTTIQDSGVWITI